jgi:hypothetical protein
MVPPQIPFVQICVPELHVELSGLKNLEFVDGHMADKPEHLISSRQPSLD